MKVIAAVGSQSYSNSEYWLLSHILDQVMSAHEEKMKIEVSKKKKRDQDNIQSQKGDLEKINIEKIDDDSSRRLSVGSVGSQAVTKDTSLSVKNESPGHPKPVLRNLIKKYFTAPKEDPFSKMMSTVVEVTERVKYDSGLSSRTSRFKQWVKYYLLYSLDFQGGMQPTMIHGYEVMEIVHLAGDIFGEVVLDEDSSLINVNKPMQQLLLKALIVRVLKLALGDHHCLDSRKSSVRLGLGLKYSLNLNLNLTLTATLTGLR
jgi:hypothetical protein